MSFFEIISFLITLAALFSYVNARYIKLPTTIGVMLVALVTSLALTAAGSLTEGFREHAAELVNSIDFEKTLLHGMLAFLLFAGSIQLDLHDLMKEWLPISVLALFGTLVSTFAVGGLLWLVVPLIGLQMPLIHCLIFGALISPTDPIAVLGILKKAGTTKELETQTAGESLFNDGIGVVIFLILLEVLAEGSDSVTASHIAYLLLKEAVGGFLIGLVAGFAIYQLLKQVDNYQVEVLLTLALAMGGYALSDALHVSAPIAIVVAGLFIGNQGRHFAMSPKTEEHIDTFWELIDEILNVVLFMLIGLEVLVMPFQRSFILIGVIAIIVTLLARWASVAGLVALMKIRRPFARGTVTLLTWGGLRGGISVALALSLPQSPYRNLLLAITYCVVIFSVCVQGLSMGYVIRRVSRAVAPS